MDKKPIGDETDLSRTILEEFKTNFHKTFSKQFCFVCLGLTFYNFWVFKWSGFYNNCLTKTFKPCNVQKKLYQWGYIVCYIRRFQCNFALYVYVRLFTIFSCWNYLTFITIFGQQLSNYLTFKKKFYNCGFNVQSSVLTIFVLYKINRPSYHYNKRFYTTVDAALWDHG
jgi:hypothetical protein